MDDLEPQLAYRYGELDIVMLNPEYTVVFVEVKSRRSMHYGYPQEAITPGETAQSQESRLRLAT